ncbi:RT RNaseH 2 domain-containing protein [Abeliophyllum distichum]|uniref:RT RNaseH 2 domain-containing protein n=1 Tax=Abeliophyllum distichum TaxID=126358 RepID=A0ABD1V3A8_9LAMI
MPTHESPKVYSTKGKGVQAVEKWLHKEYCYPKWVSNLVLVPKSSEKMRALKGKKRFKWTSECEDAFQALKQYLEKAPLLSKPSDKEVLMLYLAVSREAISVVLVRKDDGYQRLVYYVSKVLLDVETRYPDIEKLALA